MEFWELAAREAIRDAIFQYNYAGDRLMIEEMVRVFCEDGVLETSRDNGTHVGREAIFGRLGGGRGTGAPRHPAKVSRHHMVTNVHFLSLTPVEAQVSSYFAVLTQGGLDHFGRYRDVFVPVGDRWLIKHRTVRRDWQRHAIDDTPREARS